jgi:hypothetical protein
MDRPEERETKPTDRRPRISYSKPQLQIYGDLRQITQNMGSKSKHDNPAKSGTHLGNS